MREFEAFNKLKKSKQQKETDTIKDAWFYPRVSSKGQFDNNDSIENQTQVSQSYAQKNNIVISKTFGGTYESASGDFTRKEFMRLINEVKRSRKRPKYILIYIMSRFSRTGGNAIALANMLVEEMGVNLIETSSGLSTETDIGKMAVYQKLIEARKETISRLDSTIPGMKSALLSGKWLCAVPLGYTKYGPRVKDQERFSPFTRIEINEDGKLLKLAWKWKARGERDIDIRKKLKNKGLDINSKRMSEIWRKPFYAGIIVHNMIDQVVKGKWEPLVSQKDFLIINNLLEDHNRMANRGYNKERPEDARPLNGDLICGNCGAKLTSYSIKKKPKTAKPYELHYYNCYDCKQITVNANSSANSKTEGLHNQFEKFLKSYHIEKKYHLLLEKYLIKIANNRSEEYKKEIKEDKKRYSELKKELETLEERFAFGKIPENIYTKYSQRIEKQIIELEEKIGNGNDSTSNRLENIRKIISNLSKLDSMWTNGSFQFKKRLQKTMFPRGMVIERDKRLHLTDNLNIVFAVIGYFIDSCNNKKSGQSIKNIDLSAFVPRGGLEPPTSGL